jgi:hypothetical protein
MTKTEYIPTNADGDYNALGYPEDRCMADDLAAEPSPAGSMSDTGCWQHPRLDVAAVASAL